MRFSEDRDLLVFEPRLFAELAWPGQVLAGGADGQLDGASFASESADFASAGVAGGMVLTVSGGGQAEPPASVEIVEVVSAGELTVSALRADAAGEAVPPRLHGAGEDLAWHVVTFDPQAEAVALEMLAHFALQPADPASPWSAGDIARPQALRTVSACGVLATALTGAANRVDSADGYWAKAAHYRRLFERGLSRVRLGLDRGGDGRVDALRQPGAPRLKRD